MTPRGIYIDYRWFSVYLRLVPGQWLEIAIDSSNTAGYLTFYFMCLGFELRLGLDDSYEHFGMRAR